MLSRREGTCLGAVSEEVRFEVRIVGCARWKEGTERSTEGTGVVLKNILESWCTTFHHGGSTVPAEESAHVMAMTGVCVCAKGGQGAVLCWIQ